MVRSVRGFGVGLMGSRDFGRPEGGSGCPCGVDTINESALISTLLVVV